MINRGNAFAIFAFLSLGALITCVCLVFFNDDDIEPSDVVIDKPSEKMGEVAGGDSLDLFEQLILDNPASPVPYLERAGWHLRNGRITEGLSDLDQSLNADSTYGPAWSAKADALYLLNQFEACINHLDVCLDYSPEHIPCKLRRAEMFIHLKQFEKAFGLLNDALKIDQLLHEAYWMKGQIYTELQDYENALSSYQTAVEVNPNFFDGYIKLGIINSALKNPIAVDYYNAAISIRPKSVEAKYNLAMHYQENQHYEEALDLYTEIMEIDTGNASAAFNSGFIYLEYLQDYSQAEVWFTEAIERLPYYFQAFHNRGICRESMGDLNGALEDYNETLRLKPTYEPAAKMKSRVLNSMQNQQ